MAFPETVDTFVQAIDPSTTIDANNITNYQTELANGNFSAAADILASMANGLEMNMNAGRFNSLLNAVSQIEQFYLGLDGVKQYIQDNINAYVDIQAYNATTNYVVGNVCTYNGNWYRCILASVGNLPTNETYWETLLVPNPAKQYQIDILSNIDVGTMEIGEICFVIEE